MNVEFFSHVFLFLFTSSYLLLRARVASQRVVGALVRLRLGWRVCIQVNNQFQSVSHRLSFHLPQDRQGRASTSKASKTHTPALTRKHALYLICNADASRDGRSAACRLFTFSHSLILSFSHSLMMRVMRQGAGRSGHIRRRRRHRPTRVITAAGHACAPIRRATSVGCHVTSRHFQETPP